MRLLILAAALAFTASPALGQFRPELPQRAEQGNASPEVRLGLMYDFGWDVPQNDAEAGSWKRILVGAGIGLTAGFGIGWLIEEVRGPEDCPVFHSGGGDCVGFWDEPYHISITGSLVGAGVGAALGWLWPFGGVAPD